MNHFATFILLSILLFEAPLMADSNDPLSVNLDIARLNAIHDYYCPASPRCSLGEKGNVHTSAYNTSCCGDCSCDLETCSVAGTCCPATLRSLSAADETKAGPVMSCDYAKIPQHERSKIRTNRAFRMVRECDDDHGYPDNIDKCENYKIVKPLTLDTILPVTDYLTDITYQNRFCALCNNVAEDTLIRWYPDLQCNSSSNTSNHDNLETLIDSVLSDTNCNLLYTPPEKVNDFAHQQCFPTAIDECNVTGKWVVYNPDFERSCHAYEVYFFDEDSQTIYRNVFCFMCNIRTPPKPAPDCKESMFNVGKTLLSFGAILKLKSEEEIPSTRRCPTSHILDPLKGTCKAVTCLSPKLFDAGSCRDVLHYIDGMLHIYEAFIKVIPSPLMNPGMIHEVIKKMLVELDLYGNSFLLQLTRIVTAYYKPTQVSSDDDGKTVRMVEYLVFYIESATTKSNLLVFLNKVLKLDDRRLTISAPDTFEIRLELGAYRIGSESFPTFQTRDGTGLVFYSHVFKTSSGENPGHVNRRLITKTSACPLIELNDYPSERLANGDLLVKDLGASLPANAYIIQAGNTALICIDDFLSLAESQLRFKQAGVNQISKGHTMALGILSLTLAVLSLVCLSLTLVTYLLLKDLRTQPGINNMCLVASLMIAQSLYQFGVGQADKVREMWCQIIGILTHFFWLKSMCWMNVCSLHMFFVFNSLRTINDNGKIVRRTSLYTGYCVLMSGALVAINVAVSFVKGSGDVDFGYGGAMCYVSDYFMNLYTFVIPVGLVVSVNLCLFIAVIVTVKRLPNMARHTQKSRNFLKIYAKLSCITGISWLVGAFVYTHVVVFEYVFIILTAGQGVFIFVSFVCNTRVRNLYRGMLRGQEPGSKSTATT